MTTTLIAIGAIACYLAAGLIIGLRLFRSDAERLPARAYGLAAIGVGLALHGLLLYHDTVTAAGLNLGFFNAFSLSAWVILALLLASSLGKPVENLGLVLLPLGALAHTPSDTLTPPNGNIIYGPDCITGELGTLFGFVIPPNPAATYQWEGPGGFSSTQASFAPPDTGLYILTAMATMIIPTAALVVLMSPIGYGSRFTQANFAACMTTCEWGSMKPGISARPSRSTTSNALFMFWMMFSL